MTRDHWNPETYRTNAAFVPELATPAIRDLATRQGERLLDLGCGDGVLTRHLMDLGCIVVGIDSSPSFVEAARSRGVDARLCDAQEIEFEDEFDAVFSNAALHWMRRQKQLSNRVYRALKPGGRFVVEMGGEGNIETIGDALATAMDEHELDFDARNPWTFPNPMTHARMLTSIGFEVRKCELRRRPTVLPTDLRGWLATFSQELLAGLDDQVRNAVMDRTVELCRPELCDDNGNWTVDYVRLNFVAVKPGRIGDLAGLPG